MSKITFRADDDLVADLEALEISKSEAMREALRAYLDDAPAEREPQDATELGAIDELIRQRVDELVAERLQEWERERDTRRGAHARAGTAGDVTVTVSLEDETHPSSPTPRKRGSRTMRGHDEREHVHDEQRPHRPTGSPVAGSRERDESGHPSDSEATRQCGQCGESVDDEHVYCPNCGEKASRRLFCECGDEIRSDWSFCPSCGRRTPAADVLERDSHT